MLPEVKETVMGGYMSREQLQCRGPPQDNLPEEEISGTTASFVRYSFHKVNRGADGL